MLKAATAERAREIARSSSTRNFHRPGIAADAAYEPAFRKCQARVPAELPRRVSLESIAGVQSKGFSTRRAALSRRDFCDPILFRSFNTLSRTICFSRNHFELCSRTEGGKESDLEDILLENRRRIVTQLWPRSSIVFATRNRPILCVLSKEKSSAMIDGGTRLVGVRVIRSFIERRRSTGM